MGVFVGVFVGVTVFDGVLVGVDVFVGVLVLDGVFVLEGVVVGVGVESAELEGVLEGVFVDEGVLVFEGVTVFEGVAEGVTVLEGVTVFDGLEIIEYENLGGYVWKDQIIDRDFDICNSDDCDYKTFISNISNGNEGRINSVRSTIGFLLHGYKDKSFCPAVIVNDEVISDNPEGGTGKGLLVHGISELKKNIIINGKEFAFDKSFAYQLVSADTQILTFDDVRKNFGFENLFSVITEGITLEKKNKDAIKIPYEHSPEGS